MRLVNLSTDRTHLVDADALEVLGCCGSWVTRDQVDRILPHRTRASIEAQLSKLAAATMLVRLGDPVPQRDGLLQEWGDWTPAAAQFHLATRNVPFVDPSRTRQPVVTLRTHAPALKEYSNAERLELPRFSRDDAFAQLLVSRRTWRRYADAAIPLEAIARLSGLTWGVQSWMVCEGVFPQALKTSPSGGARHSIEAYVCALRVTGLPPGIYHYGPDAHALTLVRDRLTEQDVTAFLPAQDWYKRAAVIFFMTSIFARVQWRYPHPRAYRNVYIEAGHLAQTFCLLAAEMGLAPFCTAAISEDAVEPALGIDGVSEAVLYAVGAGSRPENTQWAPLPETDLLPKLVQPSYMTRSNEREPGVE